MAPEQIAGGRCLLGPWTDLYTLGCIGRSLGSSSVALRALRFVRVAGRRRPRPSMMPRRSRKSLGRGPAPTSVGPLKRCVPGFGERGRLVGLSAER